MTRAEESPWAIAVAQIAEHAGLSTTIDTDMPAPSGIGDEIVGVEEGAPVHITGSMDSIVDGLIFNAHLRAPMHAECTRCLRPLSGPKELDIAAFFPYQMTQSKAPADLEIIAGQEEAEDGSTYPLSEGGSIANIEALLRDSLVEAMPLQALCKPDCKGLCPQCGINLNEHPDHQHDLIDNRWAALEGLKEQLSQEQQ